MKAPENRERTCSLEIKKKKWKKRSENTHLSCSGQEPGWKFLPQDGILGGRMALQRAGVHQTPCGKSAQTHPWFLCPLTLRPDTSEAGSLCPASTVLKSLLVVSCPGWRQSHVQDGLVVPLLLEILCIITTKQSDYHDIHALVCAGLGVLLCQDTLIIACDKSPLAQEEVWSRDKPGWTLLSLCMQRTTFLGLRSCVGFPPCWSFQHCLGKVIRESHLSHLEVRHQSLFLSKLKIWIFLLDYISIFSY